MADDQVDILIFKNNPAQGRARIEPQSWDGRMWIVNNMNVNNGFTHVNVDMEHVESFEVMLGDAGLSVDIR